MISSASSQIRLTGMWRYPVKSMRGAALQRAMLGRRGLLGDREWMVVDAQGGFLSQRQLPRMALIDTVLDGPQLWLHAPGMSPLAVAPVAPTDPRCTVQVWRDRCEAVVPDVAADEWLSGFLGRPVRLVYLPPDSRRAVDPTYAAAGDEVGFADGFPLLLISQASLDQLNDRLAAPIPMARFRPNLVVDGCPPHAEDDWRRIRIGDTTFRVAKPCSRCIVPAIDIATAQRGDEPLRTLRSYRHSDDGILFGQNLIHDDQGALEVGMPVEVLD